MAAIKGAVAAGHAATADAAEAVLREGGNAFDAALAAIAAATVAEPVLSSLGGGGFLMAQPANGKPVLYDFFTQTPKQRRREDEVDFFPIVADFGATQQEFHIGMASVATPGMVRGLFDVHTDLGRMPMTEVLAPAVALAKQGLQLNRLQAYIFSVVGPIYESNPTILAQFESSTRPGELCGEGDFYRCPDQADALDALAHEGAELFYRGEMGASLIEACRDRGGHLTRADLQDYRLERRAPLTRLWRDARLLTNPPPSSGGLLIAFALELLRDETCARDGFGGWTHLDRLTRAMALTNKARVDHGLHEAGEDGAVARLLDPGLVESYRQQVLGRPAASRGTTHVSVMDGEGNAAAVTVSNGEGSGYVLPGTGIVINNMLGEEDINPHGFHQWPTDMRQASMMAPSLLLKANGGQVALGSGGSNRIRTAILQVLLNIGHFGMALEEAVPAPRLHFERGRLNAEPGFEPNLLNRLSADPLVEDLCQWDDLNLFFGGVHAVSQDRSGVLHGAGDPRRGGVIRVLD
ncbi:gamma-glutamyltransferase [Magnetospira sp. QH-2]|uniref:gamma-glutamyltransferase n=1 Tax=Magnetospira sp. (strain QH-2) TaxID=1288970 RepID=UPI0003E8107A|nr:gamma-glutamyltransferase [Magnetospira sp. QH-2]CCQ75167.1 putative gamma-glutamyltranspeptidase [Magnetospira sp. QH-2]